MAKSKVSERDFLIEQCIQDARYERLDEGWWDDVKANVRGAGEWLKQDAKDSFKLRKKGDVKNNRKYARINGKVKSYANSIANTLKDYKSNGGTLGRNIENIDDVINRLTQVANGQAPRGLNRNRQTQVTQPAQPAQPNNIQQQTPPQQSTQKNSAPAQKATNIQKSSISKSNNTSNNVSSTGNSNSANTPAQNTMLDTIDSNNTSEQDSNSDNAIVQDPSLSQTSSVNGQQPQPAPNSENQPQTQSTGKIERDKKLVRDRAKNIKNIRKQRAKEAAAKAKAEKVKKNGTFGQRISKGVANTKDKISKGVKDTYNRIKDKFAKPPVYDGEIVENEPEQSKTVNPNARPIRRTRGRVEDNPTPSAAIDNTEILDGQSNSSSTGVKALPNSSDENNAITKPAQKALPGSGTYVGEFGAEVPGASYTGSTYSQTDKGDAYIGGLQQAPEQQAALGNKQNLLSYTPDEDTKKSSEPTKKSKRQNPLAKLRSNIDPSKLANGRKLKVGPKPTKRRRVLTAKNALDNERSQENMRKMVDANPDMFMYDSYNPYKNTKGQLTMLDTF